MKPVKAEVLASKIEDTGKLLIGGWDRYRWFHDTAHAPGVRAQNERNAKGAHSDPTAGAVLDDWNVEARSAMQEFCRHVVAAHRSALAAYRALARAEEREPEHGWRPQEPMWTPRAELEDAENAQKRRASRGEGHGAA